MQIPLFPLHTVLSPGIALPLKIFEDRYRVMIRRCVEASTPFGVVLIRDGREVGPTASLAIAGVGPFAESRQAEGRVGRPPPRPAAAGRGPRTDSRRSRRTTVGGSSSSAATG